MKTIIIKGKEYIPVVERVKEFHSKYPSGNIQTEIISNDENRVVVKASVKIPSEESTHAYVCAVSKYYKGETTLKDLPQCTCEYKEHQGRTFTGHSQASWKMGIMKDVALEVAETSAIGRALGFANIGLLDGIASAEEMRKVGRVDNGKSIQDRDDDPLSEDNQD